MSIKIVEEKWRNGQDLDPNDQRCIKQYILSTSDLSINSYLIYVYAYNFDKDLEIAEKLEFFIFEKPEPGITSTCIEALMVLWVPNEKYVAALESYLDYSKYKDEWHYEVVVSINVFLNEPQLQTKAMNDKILLIFEEARIAEDHNFLRGFDKAKVASLKSGSS